MGDPAWNHEDVDRRIAHDLIGDAHPATANLLDRWRHIRRVQPMYRSVKASGGHQADAATGDEQHAPADGVANQFLGAVWVNERG
jgi:hypothetical protein